MTDNRVMKIITVILWSLVVIAASALIIVVNRMQGVQSATVTPDLSVPAMQGKSPVANGDGTISSDSDGVYCYDSHEDQLTGWQRIDGERYYFDPANGGKAAIRQIADL
ncbi:MAG: hypothetical protein K6F79_06075 [Saccharofermentans sp.]|nr:hypothetical protein [Saccharofermentans sp.]